MRFQKLIMLPIWQLNECNKTMWIISLVSQKIITDDMWLAIDWLQKLKTNKKKIQLWSDSLKFSQVGEAKSLKHLIQWPSFFKEGHQLLEKHNSGWHSWDHILGLGQPAKEKRCPFSAHCSSFPSLSCSAWYPWEDDHRLHY